MKLTNDWIVGFVDGDGYFGINKTNVDTDRFSFVVSQDKRSVSVLYAIKAFFKCGSVYKVGKNRMEYKVSSTKHLVAIIIPFFEKNPLRTMKRESFSMMAQQCFHSCQIKKSLNIEKDLSLNLDWLIGFIDAEGSFLCSFVEKQFIPKMIIGLHSKDFFILDCIQKYLGYGIRYTGKNQVEIFQLSSQKDNYLFLTNYVLTKSSKDRLKTQKRIQARKWSKLILFLQTNQHLTPEGWTKAYTKYVNFKNSLKPAKEKK